MMHMKVRNEKLVLKHYFYTRSNVKIVMTGILLINVLSLGGCQNKAKTPVEITFDNKVASGQPQNTSPPQSGKEKEPPQKSKLPKPPERQIMHYPPGTFEDGKLWLAQSPKRSGSVCCTADLPHNRETEIIIPTTGKDKNSLAAYAILYDKPNGTPQMALARGFKVTGKKLYHSQNGQIPWCELQKPAGFIDCEFVKLED